ncbi:hypothetical protein ZOSMA_924G00010 [Zostera marina]|uniref:Uncharacterized protein n=1 Tax=Zostera marina TaxID=29655 RepID=A0A0K9NIZ9_ZOSMR|nr:hypothetical protein ZOSMA_924G00010 [Zostera marina]
MIRNGSTSREKVVFGGFGVVISKAQKQRAVTPVEGAIRLVIIEGRKKPGTKLLIRTLIMVDRKIWVPNLESKEPSVNQDKYYSHYQRGQGSVSSSSFAIQYQISGLYPQTFREERGGNVPIWEKNFCYSESKIKWKTICEAKKMLPDHKKVAEWDDSSGKEAFFNSKHRYWAKINNLPCDIPLPDPDMYLDKHDPKTIGFRNEVPPATIGWEYEVPLAVTCWRDEVSHAVNRWGDGVPPAVIRWGDDVPPAAVGLGEYTPAATGWSRRYGRINWRMNSTRRKEADVPGQGHRDKLREWRRITRW